MNIEYFFPNIPEPELNINNLEKLVENYILALSLDSDELIGILELAKEYKLLFEKINQNQKIQILKLLNYFLQENQYLQAKKLIKYAVFYLGSNSFSYLKEIDNKLFYKAIRNGEEHIVFYNAGKNTYSCDCALSNGLPPYQNEAGICSHIECLWILKH